MHTTPRLLFLHPKTLIDSWPCPVDTLGEVIKVPSLVYPLLAASIADLPFQVDIFDGYVTPETFASYKRRLACADIVAITVMTPLKAVDTELTIRLMRALNPAVKIILGGNHASSFPERWIERGADYVIVKEGETAFRRLLESLAYEDGDCRDIPNLTYRDRDGQAVNTAVTAPLVELDNSPLPAWHRMNLRPYSGFGPFGLAATVEVSRGCPHRCDFCNINKFWGYKQRYKSVERVVVELESMHRVGVRQFFFADDNFGHDYRHTVDLLEEMIRRNWGFSVGAFIRGDTVARHPEFAKLAARAGLKLALMGIESLDSKWLRLHRKGVLAKDVTQMYSGVYETLKQNGIFLVGLFITGADAAKTYKSGRGADGVVCDYHYSADIVAQRGSALYDQLETAGGLVKDMFYHDWNMPSVQVASGVQNNHRTVLQMLRDFDRFNVRNLFTSDPVARSFRWRNLAVLAERIACTTAGDVKRYRLAKETSLHPAERQSRIVDSILNGGMVEHLVKSDRWKSPLMFRYGYRDEPASPGVRA